MRSSELVLKSDAQKVITKSGFGHKFHGLKYFEDEFHFMFLDLVKIEGMITKQNRKKTIYYNFIMF